MPYQTLNEILSALDGQQRKELAALAEQGNEAERNRVRYAKQQLYTTTVFFIERSWELLAPQVEAFSLEAESGKSAEELQVYLESLRLRQSDFAWGWTRARMDAWMMKRIEMTVPVLMAQYPEQAALYTRCLHKMGSYWFRQSPVQHLQAGYHTALGAACKWYGSAHELQRTLPSSCPHTTVHFHDELRRFASFSLTMLVRTDRYLWDSAGAEPLDARFDNGTFEVAAKPIEQLTLADAPDYGLRLGCPALRARSRSGLPAFAGVVAWVEQVFARYLLERSADDAAGN